MHEPRMKEAVDACHRAGIGLTAMKTQGGGPLKSDSESEIEMAGRFMQIGLARSSFETLPAETGTLLTQLDFSQAERSCPRNLPIGSLMREAAILLA